MGRLLDCLPALMAFVIGCASEPPRSEPPKKPDAVARPPLDEGEAVAAADDVKASLAKAMRRAPPSAKLDLSHEPPAHVVNPALIFALPHLTDGWIRNPGAAPPANPGDPELDDAYDAGGYLFSIDVCKVNTLWYKLGQPDGRGGTWSEESLDPLCKLFEFRIHIMDRAPDGSRRHVLTTSDRFGLK